MNFVWFYDFYQVYDDGRIYSIYQQCWITPQIDFNGSAVVVYLPHRSQSTLRIQWKYLVALCHVFRPDESYDRVRILDGNEWNVRADNLQWYQQIVEDPYEGKTWKNSSRSIGNSKRWENEEFRAKMTQKIRERMTNCVNDGCNNPNFRYYITYNGKRYTIAEMSALTGVKPRQGHELARRMRLGRPNQWSDIGAAIIDVRTQKGQSTIEKLSPDRTE